MKLKELLNLMRSAISENTKFTLVDYDIYAYLDGTETENICSFSSDFKPECFLKDSVLEAEVIAMGIKSETEMVFELTKKESKVVERKTEPYETITIPNTNGVVLTDNEGEDDDG